MNFNSHDLLARNLAELDLEALDARMYVVDNFHSLEAAHAIGRLCAAHGWTLISSPQNLGFGAGMNLGVSHAVLDGCDHLALVNPDAQGTTATLEALLLESQADPFALVSPRIVRSDGRPWFTGGRIDMRTGHVTATAHIAARDTDAWLTAAYLVTSQQAWRILGGFDPDYFLYWEDVDLSHRAVAAGMSLIVREDLEVVHDAGGTQRSGEAKSDVYIYYNSRNPLVFASKRLDHATRSRWITNSPSTVWRMTRRGDRRHPVRLARAALSATRGAASGIAFIVRAQRRSAHG